MYIPDTKVLEARLFHCGINLCSVSDCYSTNQASSLCMLLHACVTVQKDHELVKYH